MSNELHSKGGSRAEQFWERHYRRSRRRWSGWANPVLVDVAGSVPAGTALDLGCGEGGDAIWLAALGWRVTAVDVSATALDRASADAASYGVDAVIDFQQHDLTRSFPAGAFDLVSAQYLHSPVDFPRDRVLQAAARAVAPGGQLLIVDHGSVRPWAWNPDPHTSFRTPEEVLAALDLTHARWRTEALGSPERQAVGPDGESATVTDNVIAVSAPGHQHLAHRDYGAVQGGGGALVRQSRADGDRHSRPIGCARTAAEVLGASALGSSESPEVS